MDTSFLSHFSTTALLERLGLQRRRSNVGRIMSSLGLLAIGVVVGATAALLLTPKSGRALRTEIREGASRRWKRPLSNPARPTAVSSDGAADENHASEAPVGS